MRLLNKYLQPKTKALNFLVFILVFAIILAILIYWRENDVRDKVSFIHVIFWQIVIWIPWTLCFPLFETVKKYSRNIPSKKTILYGSGFLWIGVHYTWFLLISSYFSPYKGLPATGYGVYPYFFIFWTLVDIGLIWYVLNNLDQDKTESTEIKPFVFELSRGDKKYYCKPNQIYWISAEDYYSKFYTEHGEFLVRSSLKKTLELLPQKEFMRIHRSTLINVNYVSGLARTKNEGLEVMLKDGSRRRVSRNYTRETKIFFRDWSF